MLDQIAAWIVDESKWLPVCMTAAALAVAAALYRHRHRALPVRPRVLAAMSLFFGVTIACMAFGHLLAVTTKLALGTLEGSALWLYAIGLALAVPALWLGLHVRRVLARDGEHGRATVFLNAWLGLTLLALGLQNLPLAAPAFLNAGYGLSSRPAVGWTIVGLAAVLQAGLLVGSLLFMASGQSFEEFSGMR